MPTTVAALLFPFLFFALCAAVAFADQSPAQQKTTAWWCVIMRCPVVPLVPLFPDFPPWNINPGPPWFQPPLPPFAEPGPYPVTQPPPPPRSHHHSHRNRRRHSHPPSLPRRRHHSRNHGHPPPLPRLSSATRNHRHPQPLPPLPSVARNHRHPPPLPRLNSATRNHRHHRHPRLRSSTRDHRHPQPLPPLPSVTRNHRHPPPLPRLRSATRNRKHTSGRCRLRHPSSTETITIKPILPPSQSAAVQHSPAKPTLAPSPSPGNSEPLILPPVSTNQTSDCSMALIKGDVCIEDLTQSASGNQILIKRECCNIISQLSDECFHKAFTQFSDPNFRNKARAFCSP